MAIIVTIIIEVIIVIILLNIGACLTLPERRHSRTGSSLFIYCISKYMSSTNLPVDDRDCATTTTVQSTCSRCPPSSQPTSPPPTDRPSDPFPVTDLKLLSASVDKTFNSWEEHHEGDDDNDNDDNYTEA